MENNYLIFGIVFFASLILSLYFLKSFIRFSKHKKLLDLPDERKKHKIPTPSSGGIVFAVLMISMSPYILLKTDYGISICAAFFLLIVGFLDDRFDLSAKVKFSFQIIATLITLYTIGPLELFQGDFLFLNEIITFLFVIGFTNAFNLIDGIDGLAGTYAGFVFIIITIVLLENGNYDGALITVSIIAGIIAFLVYNLNPAKIFMGDTGSLFLGFTISIFTIVAINGSGEATEGITSKINLELFFLSVLALPMIDTIRVMFRRILRKKSPFNADRSHLHHILMKTGLKPMGITLTFLAIALILSIESITLRQVDFSILFVLLSLFISAIFIFNLILIIRIRQHKKRMFSYENSLNYIVKDNQLIRREPLQIIRK